MDDAVLVDEFAGFVVHELQVLKGLFAALDIGCQFLFFFGTGGGGFFGARRFGCSGWLAAFGVELFEHAELTLEAAFGGGEIAQSEIMLLLFVRLPFKDVGVANEAEE